MYGNINSVHPLDEKPPGVSELRLISYVENDERNVAKLIDAKDQKSAAAPVTSSPSHDHYQATRIGMYASWLGNLALLAAKVVAFAVSGSYSVLASLIDSIVDVISQCLVASGEWCNRYYNPSYPVGRQRLDNASVLGATLIMVVAVVLIIRESAGALAEGIQSGIYPNLDLGPVFYGVIGGSTIVKLGLWLYCRTIADLTPAMKALSEDHWNDVVMNVAALVFPIIAFYERKVWWIDPAGGLAISAYILWRWYEVGMEQVRNIVGVVAPQEFIAEVKAVAESHHLRMKLLQVVAYHCGQGYIVEVEMLMDEHALLGESNDLAESLQLKIEELDNVERVYVHVSNETRDFYGGKVERGLLDKTIIPKSLVVSRHPPASSSNYMGRVKTASHRRSFGRHVPIMRLDDVEKGDDR